MSTIRIPHYVIASGTGLVLTAAENGIVASHVPDHNLPTQQWYGYPVGDDVMFINYAIDSNGSLLTVSPNGDLWLTPFLPQYVMANVVHWNVVDCTIKNPYPSWAFPVSQIVGAIDKNYKRGSAIRPASDHDRNLNILGDGPYNDGSVVAAWNGWGGGDPNEVWFLGKIDEKEVPAYL